MGRFRLTPIAAALLSAAILVLVPVALAATAPSLPSVFAGQIRAIHRVRHAPAVLLPRSMPLDAKRLFATGGISGTGYDLELGAVRHCGGANACFVAAFSAAKGARVYGRHVTVSGASRAGFLPLSCGASCAPPQIDFIWHGVRYAIQANLKTKQSDRAALIAAAESAISAGPR
ncbi:MAG: hypothetical protein ACJ780_04705 [Solirubrobacteraceae bacterium]